MSKIKDKKSSSGISRRDLLKGAAAAVGTAAGSGAITGFPTIWAQNIQNVTLNHVGSVYTTNPLVAEEANKQLGFTINMQTLDTTSQMNRLLAQPETIDIADMGNPSLKYFVGKDTLMPIPINEYKWWDKTLPLWVDGTYANGEQASRQGFAPILSAYYADETGLEWSETPTDWLVSIPLVTNADTFGIRPDLINRPIESWAELFNPEFSGRVALQDGVNVGVPDAAMALEAMGDVQYVNKGNMTIEEIDKTIDKLIEYKRAGQFRSFWTTFDQSVQLIASGEVVLQSMFSPAVTEVRTRGIPCIFQGLKEGYRGWAISAMPLRHVTQDPLKRDCVMEYLNWMNSGWYGAYISRTGYYTSVPDNAKPLMTENEWGYWYEGKASTDDIIDPYGKVMEKAGVVRDGGGIWDRMGNIAIWNTLMDEDRYLVRRWQDFIAA